MEELTANTYAGYVAYMERDLIPAFGRCRLLDLRPKQIEAWVAAQRKAGLGRVTLHRVVSTLRNALNHAVRSWRLKFNPAEQCVPPKPRAEERTCWTPREAAAFLRHNTELKFPPAAATPRQRPPRAPRTACTCRSSPPAYSLPPTSRPPRPIGTRRAVRETTVRSRQWVSTFTPGATMSSGVRPCPRWSAGRPDC